MADNKYGSYSFYVPPNDKKLTEFIGAQSNISRTIQMLLKAFVYNYEGEYPDVVAMDLRELIDNMDPDPEKLVEISDEIDSSRKRKAKIKEEEEQTMPATVKEEVVHVVDDEDDDKDEDENNGSDVENARDDSDNDDAGEPEKSEELESEPDVPEGPEETAEEPDAVVNDDEDDEDDEDDDVNVSVTDDIPDDNISGDEDQSEAETNLREKYNKQQDASEIASPDDIMSLMGDM